MICGRCFCSLLTEKAAILLPTNDEEVSASVKACRSIGANFVVRGGGHNPSGASSIENGVVIDLRKMNQVTVDIGSKTVTAGGGALWTEVDLEAGKYNLCCVGGSLNFFSKGSH
jgi:FAD/FMN-containing dehydrogenase